MLALKNNNGGRMSENIRAGFKHFVIGLDELIEHGIPQGFWVSISGTPGSFKTLHSIAFCLSALLNKQKCIYVSPTASFHQILNQIESLGWGDTLKTTYKTHLKKNITEDSMFGLYELVLIDKDGLYWWASKYAGVWSRNLLEHMIITALGASGVIEAKDFNKITPEDIKNARLKDSYFDNSKALFKFKKDSIARVVIDDINRYILMSTLEPDVTLMHIKNSLEAPNINYLLTVADTSKHNLEEKIGHIVDGNIRLWNELETISEAGMKELVPYGLVTKMRNTNHNRVVHRIILEKNTTGTFLKWVLYKNGHEITTT